jgi:hypothetical protein
VSPIAMVPLETKNTFAVTVAVLLLQRYMVVTAIFPDAVIILCGVIVPVIT